MAQVNPVQLEKFLKGVDYPLTKKDLIKFAEQHGADRQIREALEQLPDQTFERSADISKAMGSLNRSAR
jgi:Protein of unknown function (DUF2795)